MNCDLIEKKFEQYMDGELEPAAQAELERHISACPDCAAKYSDLVKIKQGLSTVEDEPLPAQFHAQWIAKIRKSSDLKTVSKNKFFKYMPAIAAGIAAVAIVSAAVLSGVLAPAPNTASYSNSEVAAAQDSSLAGGAAPEMKAESAEEQNVAGSDEGSLFRAQIAPSESGASSAPAASAAAEAAPQEDAAAKSADDAMNESLEIFISQESFDGMISAFDEKQIEYTLVDGSIIVTVTDANQEIVASVFRDNVIELCAVPGGTFKFSVSE